MSIFEITIGKVTRMIMDKLARERLDKLEERQTATEGRLNGLTNIPEGSEEGSYPEIRAARVDGAGKTYDSLGEAMLAQVPKSAIVQTTGNSPEKAMSQEATTREFNLRDKALSIIKAGHFYNPDSGVVDVEEVIDYKSIDVVVWNTQNIENVYLFRMKTDGTYEELESYKTVDENGTYEFQNIPITPDTSCIRIYVTKTNTEASYDWVMISKSEFHDLAETAEKVDEIGLVVESLGEIKEYTYDGTYIEPTGEIPSNTHILFEQLTDEVLYVFGMYGVASGDGFDALLTGIKGKMLTVTTEREYNHIRVYSSIDATHSFRLLVNIKSKTVVEKLVDEIDDIRNNIPVTNNNYISRIFKKVVCVGDSYTAGYVHLDGDAEYGWNPDFAWPEFMKCLTGRDWINCGSSGATVLTWMQRTNGFVKAQEIGLVQAYVVGLGINDAQFYPIPLGTIDDIGTDAQTYYGGMSALIRGLNGISPTAKIFVNTCPKDDPVYDGYNNAIREIVEAYKDTYPVFCIDLYAHRELYNNSSLTQDYMHSHYTPIGYEQFAEIYNHILSKYIIENYDKFQDVFKIPCG